MTNHHIAIGVALAVAGFLMFQVTFIGRQGKSAGEKSLIPAETPRRDLACNQVFNPVCGKDGKTYPNACHAEAAGATVDYRGECKNPFELPQKKF